ncbi:MAG: fatty acid desaturase [Candidatus Eiseniibacteriota bacterium]
MRLVAPYQGADDRRAWLQVLTSFLPFVAGWWLMAASLQFGLALTVVLAVPTAGFLVRIFIIQHDCGHGSFFASRRLNDAVGFLCGVLTLTPYGSWRRSHAIHHAGAANLARRGTGDILTLTVDEYLAAPRLRRLLYRIYRHPLTLFVVGPLFNFVILQRLPFGAGLRGVRASVLWTNLALVAAVLLLGGMIGFPTVLIVHLAVMAVASTAGTWLFYVQHQYEETYWAPPETWDYSAAALRGSSYYALPPVLRWFSGNIGFHHLHHLSPRIPSYALPRCHAASPLLQQVTTLGLRSSLRSLRLHLWDAESERLVGFGALRAIRARCAQRSV